MQLERRAHAGSPDLSCPKFVCGLCEKVIDRAEGGIVLWDTRPENAAFHAGEPVEVFVVHKGFCDRALCSVKGRHSSDFASMELAELPGYLARNLGMPAPKDQEKDRDLA